MPDDAQPSQPITDAELSALRDYIEHTNHVDNLKGDARRLLAEVDRLRSERDKMLEELQWYITDLGPEHYQNCDTGKGDCYLCDGHVAIRDEWGSAKPIGEPDE